MRGSRFMLRSLTRPALVFITMVSPSRRYHIVVSCGDPSLLRVASTAKRCSCKKARAFSVNEAGMHIFLQLYQHRLSLSFFSMESGDHNLSIGTDKFRLVASYVMNMNLIEAKVVEA